MIITDANGRPFSKPAREDFEAGIEGMISWMQAVAAHNDAIKACGNAAFVDAFRKEMRRS